MWYTVGIDYLLNHHFTMPTIAQKLTFDEITAQIGRGERPNLKKAALKAGYSDHTASKPKNITESKGWKELLATIDESPLMAKLNEIALGDDKRASIAAIQEIFKLKDRYPAGKLKVTEYDQEIEKLSE